MAYQSDIKKSWEYFNFFSKIKLDNFELESKSTECKHIIIDDEINIYNYRNKITEYEKKIPNGKNWEYYKKIVNPYEFVYTQKKYDIFPESVCIYKPLSRSYFKMIEILDIIQYVNQVKYPIKTAHVCEGPGGFIEAIHHNICKNGKKIKESVAMTLKSVKNNVPGWRRANHFLKDHKNIKIIYGEDQTGDILKVVNQDFYINYIRLSDKIDIFTADGGFDISNNYTKQEKLIFPLLLASTRIGFEVLKKGGTFVLKIFDFFHKVTTDLLYFLSQYFEEWTIYKPSISRPCNPEHYFIGNGFLECANNNIIKVWCQLVERNKSLDSLIKTQYNEEFVSIIEMIRKNTIESQINYLNKVFTMIDSNDNELIKQYIIEHQKASYEWCLKFNVPILLKNDLIEVLQIDPLIVDQFE